MNSNSAFRMAGIVASVVVLGAGLAVAADTTAGSTDWPNFRGPNHNGVSTEKGWLTAWPKEGLKQLWLAELGPSYSSVSVSGGRVYAMGSSNNKEELVYCLDAETGKEIWKHAFSNMPGDTNPGPRCTPCVDGKFVYVITMNGLVACLDATSGQVVWSKDVKTDSGLLMPHHSFSCSPIVHGDLLLVNMGPAGLAFDKKTGKIAWNNTVPKTSSGYASPVPFTLGGKPCVALLTDMALVVVNEANGQTNSIYPWVGAHGENSPDPVIIGNNLFESTPGSCALLDMSAPQGKLVAKDTKHTSIYSRCTSPVLIDGYIYGFSGNPDDPWFKGKPITEFMCVDPKDFSVKWTQDGIMEGSLVAADGKLIILDRSGMLILAEASPAAYKELGRVRVLPEPSKEEIKGLHHTYRRGACWTMPVLCNGRIYVQSNAGSLVCVDVRKK